VVASSGEKFSYKVAKILMREIMARRKDFQTRVLDAT